MVSTQGPGAVHLLNGLYDAKLDGIPVVAIVGQQNLTALGSGYQQEIDLLALFKDAASAYCEQVSAPEQVPGSSTGRSAPLWPPPRPAWS